MANIIIEKLETMVSGMAEGFFREKSFFEQVWLPFLVAISAQLYCQYISFESEVEWIGANVTGSLGFPTYAVSFGFEMLKASVVAVALKNFLHPPNGVPRPMLVASLALLGLALSYGSWWMSDKGTFYMAEEQSGPPPSDTRTAEVSGLFAPQISKLDARIDELEAKNFYWCADHNVAHKCPIAGYHVSKSREDRAALKEIEALNEQKASLLSNMNAQLAQATEQHGKAVAGYEAKKSSLHLSLENKILYCEIITWACLMFTAFVYYRIKFVGRTEGVQDSRTDAVRKDALRTDADAMAESERALQELAADNRALREELEATREAMRNNRQPDEAAKKI